MNCDYVLQETQIEGSLEDETSQGEQEAFHDQEEVGQENEPNLIRGITEDKCLKPENTHFASPVNKRKLRPNQAELSVKDHLKQATHALSTLTSKRQSQTLQDRPALYGQLLATKLRRLSRRTQVILQHKIDNLVFEAELSELDCLNDTTGSSVGKFISPVSPVTNSSSCSLLSHSPNNVASPSPVYVNSPGPRYIASPVPGYVASPAPGYVASPAPDDTNNSQANYENTQSGDATLLTYYSNADGFLNDSINHV